MAERRATLTRETKETTVNVEIVLEPAGVITGTVVDETGKPVDWKSVATS